MRQNQIKYTLSSDISINEKRSIKELMLSNNGSILDPKTMNIKSLIGFPTKDTVVKVDTMMIARGVAFDGGFGIKEVLISLDEGKSWQNSMLDDEIDPYAFRGFKFKFKPTKKGSYTIMVKAVNRLGEEQPFPKDIKWNHGGYKYNGIDSVTFKVV